MSALPSLSKLLGINTSTLSIKEHVLLEAGLFVCICEELKQIFSEEYKEYFRLLNFTTEKENLMLESTLTQLIIKDILSTEEYNLKGIAYYTDTFEEVVEEFAIGSNASPSAIFLRKLINLHMSVRRELYSFIMKKIIANTEDAGLDLEISSVA